MKAGNLDTTVHEKRSNFILIYIQTEEERFVAFGTSDWGLHRPLTYS
jgi:hypothetical protein